MGLSFLKRKKKKEPPSLQIDTTNEPIVHRTRTSDSTKDDATVSRFAILQPATSMGGDSATRSASRSGTGSPNLITPTSATAGENNMDSVQGGSIQGDNPQYGIEQRGDVGTNSGSSSADGTPDYSTPNKPSSMMPALITPTTAAAHQEETPLISNQMSTLEKDVADFSEEIDVNDAFASFTDTGSRTGSVMKSKLPETQQQEEGPGKEKKSKKKSKKEKKKKKKKDTKKSKDVTPVAAAKKKRSMRFLTPSKKDTPHITIGTNTTPDTTPEREVNKAKEIKSQYDTSILDDFYNDDGHDGVELGIAGQDFASAVQEETPAPSLGDDANPDTAVQSKSVNSNEGSAGNNVSVVHSRNDADATFHSRSTSRGTSRRSGSTMKQKNLTSKPNANANSASLADQGEETEYDELALVNNASGALQLPQAAEAAIAAERTASYSPPEEEKGTRPSKKFLSKIRPTRSRSVSSKKKSQPTNVSNANTNKEHEQQEQRDVVITPVVGASQSFTEVPRIINHDDDATMPSLLTEPEIGRRFGMGARIATPPPPTMAQQQTLSASSRSTRTPASSKHSSRHNISGGTTRTGTRGGSQLPSLAEVTSGEEGWSYTMGSTTYMSSSAAAQAGGIDKILGAFTCSEDTTILGGTNNLVSETVKRVLACEPACGIGDQVNEKDAVDLELEKEENDTLEFQRDVIKNGVKLIYHESPSRASTNPDWIQSTVKLFLRPGNCHGTQLQQPTLAWAVLPVVSRRQVPGASFDSDENMWNTLGLLDVHSILVDEGDGNTTVNDAGTAASNPKAAGTKAETTASAALSTGFFSITAMNGAVYVFEAPSAFQRDYVVKGLRNIVARLTYNMIAGNADVIGELYSEDAGQLTGELPSLVSPWRALGGVTHAFLDM